MSEREYVDEPVCVVCGKVKSPAGRSTSPLMVRCNAWDCDGYSQEPYPSAYFKSESEEERNIF